MRRSDAVRVLHRVVDQVEQHLEQRVAVEAHRGQIGVDAHGEREALARARAGASFSAASSEHRPDVADRDRGLAPPALELRELEHVVDQPRQALRLAGDRGVVLLALRLARDEPVAQHLRVHADRGERRLELVGDRRDEVAAPLGVVHHHGRGPVHREQPGRRRARARREQRRSA